MTHKTKDQRHDRLIPQCPFVRPGSGVGFLVEAVEALLPLGHRSRDNDHSDLCSGFMQFGWNESLQATAHWAAIFSAPAPSPAYQWRSGGSTGATRWFSFGHAVTAGHDVTG